MATPSNGNTAHSIIPAALATNEQHICFICLCTDVDTPNAVWVDPCPCSLEAHEGCMLRYIGEMETTRRRSNKTPLACPACKVPFIIEEPYDRFLAIRDNLYRRYSRAAPAVLGSFVLGGGFAGAMWYGGTAVSIFVGRDSFIRWLEGGGRQRLPSTLIKLATLSAIGPGLLVFRWLPSLGTVLLLPFSVLYGATLVAQDNLPTWPPSPQWAMTLMPVVQLSYSYLLHDLFGPLERRLNRALRGLPATEDEAEPEARLAPNRPAARHEEEADGVRGAWANLTRAVRGLFGDDDDADEPPAVDWQVQHHVEVRIGGGGGGDNGGEDHTDEEDIRDALDEAAQRRRDIPQEPQPQPQQQQQQQQPPAAQQPAPQAAGNQNEEGGNGGGNGGGNAGAGENNNDPASFFGLIINSVVTSLLFPAISYSMGELIRAVVPKGWVSPARSWRSRAPPGLLQQRWGRSLAGGCLFVVLRDALALYTKYRRVQVRMKRKIKNVERKGQSKSQGGRP
ncbi:hypothetical protein F5144DRAFT_547555 [Chaetomium tenue]|uniref:Uncharacterized protein n=1 Tax=Chaetomium tenue TaxID=1854479 RepID=A0ACB7PA70_9PEZI|nr:hypothetical protein F5144DRAFT_547555 [Chaetomium globosum]